MTKELTPLEALEKIVDTYCIDNMDEEISIIETALKENKTLKERIILNKASFNMAKQQYEKKLKALETLKNELGFDKQSFFVEVDEEGNKKYYFEGREIDKDKFDLLKEVLL